MKSKKQVEMPEILAPTGDSSVKAPSHPFYLGHGDCLQLLPLLPKEWLFDLIYVDPPFNAGGKRQARASTRLDDEEVAYQDHWGGVDNFLSMLKPRLALMAERLSPRGSLWVHLDYRTVHDTKQLLDDILGRDAFRGEIVWIPGNGSKSRKLPCVTHQTILIYGSVQMRWNEDSHVLREPFSATSQEMHFKNIDDDGRRYRERIVSGKAYRYYLDEGRRIGSVWADCPAMAANTPLRQESTGYPTQKPESLLERIILATTDEQSWVLDPMSGSGTTACTAHRLGRSAVALDRGDVSIRTIQSRIKKQNTEAIPVPLSESSNKR